MTAILLDLSPAALAAANKANLYSMFYDGEHSPAMEFARMSGVARWHARHPYYWFNSVLCSRDPSPADGALIDETLAYFKSKGIPSIGWWLEDGVSRAGWEDLLSPRGFKFQEGSPGMSVDLAKLPERVPTPPGFEIRTVKDTRSLVPFAHLVNSVFGFSADVDPAAYEWALGRGLEIPYVNYMAYLDGTPIGTSTVYYGAGVAGIYNVAVAPEARGKGIGGALTLQPLLDARRMGYRAGILQATKMGFPVYQGLGFEQNCNVGCFHCDLA